LDRMTAASASTESMPLSHATKKCRKVNNLAISLGRMCHLKGKTLQWLKSFDKAGRRQAPMSVSVYATPSSFVARTQPLQDPPRPRRTDSPSRPKLVIDSPVLAWSSPSVPSSCFAGPNVGSICFACSFCDKSMVRGVDPIAVSFNAMLPCPYVLTCVACV
jgi:hypothetical protein